METLFLPLRIFQSIPRLFMLPALVVAVLVISDPVLASSNVQRIVVISDINGRYASTDYHPRVARAVQRITELAPDLVISTGDMVAGQRPSPKLQRSELATMWESFHRSVRIPLQQADIPILMTPGNHDASAYPGYELEREAYSQYHNSYPPSLTLIEGGNFPYHFAYDFDGTLLVSLDATKSGALGDKQKSWLKQQLCGAYHYRTKILFGHLPLQPVAIGRQRDVISDPALEELMVTGGVSAYLNGHHHAYYPGVRKGIDMLSVGNLGGNQRRLVGTSIKTGFTFSLLEIDSAGTVQISAYIGPDFIQPVDIRTLPTHLGNGAERLIRRDIAATDTSEAPSTHCLNAEAG